MKDAQSEYKQRETSDKDKLRDMLQYKWSLYCAKVPRSWKTKTKMVFQIKEGAIKWNI